MSRLDEDSVTVGPSTVSLDVLAHVAAATLEETEETKNDTSVHGETEYVVEGGQDLSTEVLRGIQSLTLEAIQSLSISALLTLFTNLTTNPLNHSFTVSCAFLPGKCQKKFTSRDSDVAMASLKTHIARHLFELLQEAEKNPLLLHQYHKTVFYKAPLSKEVSVSFEDLAKDSLKDEKIKNITEVIEPDSPSFFLVPTPNPGGKILSTPVQHEKRQMIAALTATPTISPAFEPKLENPPLSASPLILEEVIEGMDAPEFVVEVETETVSHRATPEQQISNRDLKPVINQDVEDDVSRFDHDHAYFYSNPPIPDGPSRLETETEAEQTQNVASHFIQAVEEDTGKVIYLPIIDGQIVIEVESAEQKVKSYIVEENAPILTAINKPSEVSSYSYNQNRRREYPPMPRSKFGTVKLHIREEWEPTTAEEARKIEEDQRLLLANASYNEEVKDEEWVKRTALKHIRYLRGRKKKDNYVLTCRICNDGKVFTAAATLLYHYRSHAGIKAFICQICNTSFTRQHSLNYHMLIHNGQSRFSCDICGRQFRHPQHYKEHLRRHTGETPFSCDDCGSTFKTRNTFKRHLRTRHSKLLTTEGVRLLSQTELHHMKIKEIKRHEERITKAQNVKATPMVNPAITIAEEGR